jgi:hypothetical protein
LDQHQIYRQYTGGGFFVKKKMAYLPSILPPISQLVDDALVIADFIFDFL